MAKDITIVIPVYNVENYLDESINSVLNQTIFNQLDIILVEDYSTDNSYEICRKYESRFDSIKLVNTEGKGLSDARNTGMKYAKTDYIMFMDSDDLLTEIACYKLLNAIKKYKTNIAMGDLTMFPAKTPKYIWKKFFGTGNKVLDMHNEGSDLVYMPSACNKIFNLNHLKEINFQFKSGLHFEDAYTVTPYMIESRYIALVDCVVYLYRKRETNDSIMDNIYKKKNFFDHLYVNENLIKYRSTSSALNISIQHFVTKTYAGFINNIDNPLVGLTSEEQKEIFNRLVKLFRQVNPINMYKIFNESTKVRYYAIKENDFETFIKNSINSEGLRILKGKIYPDINRVITNYKFEPTNHKIVIDRVEKASSGIKIDTIINYPYIQFTHNDKNTYTIICKNKKGDSIKIIGETYWRGDAIAPNVPEKTIGVSFCIPFNQIERYGDFDKFEIEVSEGKYNTAKMRTLYTGTLAQYNQLWKVPNGYIRVNYNASILTIKFSKEKNVQKFNRKMKQIMKKRNMVTKYRTLYYLAHPILSKKDITLIGERKDTFGDNGSHFFKYASKKRKNVYYIVDKKSPAYNEAKKYGKVIKHSSLKHVLYLLHANNVLASNNIEAYLTPNQIEKDDYWKYYADILTYKKINLQHGIAYNGLAASFSKNRLGYDKVVISNSSEEKIIKSAGYKDSEIIRSGLSRFDNLPIQKSQKIKKVLFMPTWRSNIVNKSYQNRTKFSIEDFKDTDYYKKISELLESEDLHKLLKDNNIEFTFYPHYELHEFLDAFNEHIKIPVHEKVQDLLIEADVVITDYSSIFMDVLYMKKPVIFYQFDRENFFKSHYKPGYVNFESNDYGVVGETASQVVDELNKQIENRKVITEETYNKLFDYCVDSANEAIYNSVFKNY